MVGITINTLVKAFGFNAVDFVGKKITPTDRGKTKHNERYNGLTIKSISGDEFHTGNGWHNTDEFCLGEFHMKDLDLIIKGLEEMTKDYKSMRGYLKERDAKVYDYEDVGIQKVIGLVKKSKPDEAYKLLRDLLGATPL